MAGARVTDIPSAEQDMIHEDYSVENRVLTVAIKVATV